MKKKRMISVISICTTVLMLICLLPIYGQAINAELPVGDLEQEVRTENAISNIDASETFGEKQQPEEGVAFLPEEATYTENQSQEEETANLLEQTEYTLTIQYQMEDALEDEVLIPNYTVQLEEGVAYSVPSPKVEGYTALQDMVEGQMPNQDVNVVVYYSPAVVEEADNYAIEEAEAMPAALESYKLAINYFYLDDGSAIGGSVAAEPFYAEYLEGDSYSINSPAVSGYLPSATVVSGVMDNTNRTITVWYSKAGQTAYTVQHKFEDAQGNFVGNSNYPNQLLYGQTGTQTQAQAHTVLGYTAGTVSQTAIAANGSTVVIIKYSRVTNYVYFNNGGKVYIDPIMLKFGESTTLPSVPPADGYTFDGWYLDAALTQPFSETTITMGAVDMTLYSKWLKQQASFRVATWIEDANNPGTYLYSSISSPTWATGLVGDMTNVLVGDLPVAPVQYTFVRAENVKIQPDGSSIVNVYYDRNSYTYSFFRGFVYDPWDPGAWVRSIETTPFKTITAKYGADISQQWSSMGSEFFSYNWLISNTSPWSNWISGLKTMGGADRSYYGLSMNGQHKYFLHYQFEILDQTSNDYDKLINGIKYKEDPTLVDRFSYWDQSVTIQSRSNSLFTGFYLPDADYYYQFDQNSAVKEHDGGYLYRRSTVTIDFDAAGGSSTPAQIAELYETDISMRKPADPVKAGYAFGGWYTNEKYDGAPFIFSTMPGKNVILHAKWIKNTYPVVFDLNYSGATNPPATQTVGYKETAEQPDAPQRIGYAFMGWYPNAQGTGSRYVFDKPVTAAVKLYAVWADYNVGYTVKYTQEDNGQPFAPSKQATGKYGSTITEMAQVNVAKKYVPDSASKSLYLGADPAQNMLEFKYKPYTTLAYKVEYRYAETGQLIPQSVLGRANPKIVENCELARVAESYVPVAGYEPDSLQKTKGLVYEVNAADINENVITFLYSETGVNKAEYTVEHYVQDASSVYGTVPKLVQTLSAPVGSTVNGVPQSFPEYQYNESKSAATASGVVSVSPKLTLKLYYDLNRYRVNFDSQGGSAVLPINNVIAGSVIATQKPTDPTRGADTFLGWYKEAAGVHKWNFASDVVNGNITLYAKWEQKYTVTYDANGGIGSQTDSTLYQKGASVVVKGAGGVSRVGYIFKGWLYNNTVYNADQSFVINENAVLKAVWDKETEPTVAPTEQPTVAPPTVAPSIRPTATPSVVPSATPSVSPSATPSVSPSATPSVTPTATPSVVPTALPPSEQPSPPNSQPPVDAGTTGEADGGAGTVGTGAVVKDPAELLQRMMDGDIPLGSLQSTGNWSLLNLLFAIAGLLGAAIVGIVMLVKRAKAKNNAEKNETTEQNRAKRSSVVVKILGMIAGIALLILFLILEDTSLPVTWVNHWTPMMTVIAIAELLLLVVGSQKIFGRKQPEDIEQK